MYGSQIHLINRVDWNIKSYTRRSGDRGRGRITVGQRALYRCVTVSRRSAGHGRRIRAVFKEITLYFFIKSN